jgi:hypothetical protein
MARLVDALKIIEHEFPIEQLGADVHVPNVEIQLVEDHISLMREAIVRAVRSVAYIPGGETVNIPSARLPEIKVPEIRQREIRVPKTWWDAFKRANFDILLRWFPVRYHVIQPAMVLQEARVLQKRQTIGGKNYQARAYLPDLRLPEKWGTKAIRWQELVDG